MRDVILNQHRQIIQSLEVNKDVEVSGQFDELILAGMGGSGHPGDLLNALELTTIPLRVHRSYGLPRLFGKNPLVIVSTYSGNTEESLSAYHEAKKNNYALLANTSGGKLAELAEADSVPITKIDFPGMQPRHTLLASFTGLAVALSNSGLARDITSELQAAAAFLQQVTPSLEEPGKQLASQLKNKTPVYTASPALSFAAKNFKIQTNENTKAPGFWNEFPELNHNEMVGFSHAPNPEQFHVVMLRDGDDNPRIKARMDVTTELYKSWGVNVSDFPVQGKNLLEKLFYAVTFGLWTTYYLALEYNIDPVPVEGVEGFKTKLEEIAGKM